LSNHQKFIAMRQKANPAGLTVIYTTVNRDRAPVARQLPHRQ